MKSGTPMQHTTQSGMFNWFLAINIHVPNLNAMADSLKEWKWKGSPGLMFIFRLINFI